jgi:imidazolonepropionase-like amidohydrolase/ABC-type multidrug transport system permease subunit
MNAYWTLIKIDIRLAFRQRVVIFFNYLMPLAFFFVFAQAYHAAEGGVILQVVAMVTVLGILGNGLFGAGIRAAQDREANILRRYKVAPISPLPLLVASSVTGLVIYMPYVVLMLSLAKWRYGMVMPRHMAAVLIFIVLGVLAIRSIGLIVASVANSMQESGIIVQIIYMTMLFLSGTTFPTAMFPNWLLTATQFIPATWLMTGLQGMMLRNETLLANWQAVGALMLTTAVGLFLSVKLFRWEKEEKMRPAAKLWVLAVMLPFVLLGGWQAYAKDNVRKVKIIGRDLARSRSFLIRNARIFTGDGRVIENGAVLVKEGKIAEVYDGGSPDPKALNAETIEGAGKTILPGLIDTHVHLDGPGGFYDDRKDYGSAKMMQRNLAAYLYSGVTAVRSAGDQLDRALTTRALVNSGEKQGAEFFEVGPLFTAPRGDGTADDAKKQVDAIGKAGFDGIEAVLGGFDFQILNAITAQAHADKIPVIVNTGDAREVEDALRAHVNGIEQGSFRQRIPDEDFDAMQSQGMTYDAMLSVAEGAQAFAEGKLDLLNRSLVQQVGPPVLLAGTLKAMASPPNKGLAPSSNSLDIARDNLLRAYRHGVVLIAGSGAGNVLVFHGPSVQHELQLWVDAGIPVQVALQAATLNAAKALRADARFGSIAKGKEATMLVVDGNPLLDIKATEAISFVMLKGERVDRAELFKPE